MKTKETGKPETFAPLDIADYLAAEEDIIGYLAALLEEGDSKAIAAGLDDVARVRGMAHVMCNTELGRESLYKPLLENGNPEFSTILKAFKALGFKLVPAAT